MSTSSGTRTIAYDANDHATQMNDGTNRITETLSPSGRVIRRVVADAATGLVVSEDSQVGYSDGGDSPSYARNGLLNLATTSYLPGPGGLLVDQAGVVSYPLTNAHGDIVGTTDAAGAFTPVPITDEFGAGDVPPPSRLGWLGAHERFSTGGGLKLIRMGVRLYDPSLGRFLQVDPVEGGSANDYDYAYGDPCNNYDLDGRQTTPAPGRPNPRACRLIAILGTVTSATFFLAGLLAPTVAGGIVAASLGLIFGGIAILAARQTGCFPGTDLNSMRRRRRGG